MARPDSKFVEAKMVLVGDMGTGKTSLALQFVKGQFFERQETTIGAAYFSQTVSLNEATFKFDIWDTSGQERYHSLAPMYYRNAAVALVVYDISNMDSFIRAKKWVCELQQLGNPIPVFSLVGNKVDLEAKRDVATEDAKKFFEEKGMFFIETSAKTSHNVNELFYETAKRVAEICPLQLPRMTLHYGSQNRRFYCCSRVVMEHFHSSRKFSCTNCLSSFCQKGFSFQACLKLGWLMLILSEFMYRLELYIFIMI